MERRTFLAALGVLAGSRSAQSSPLKRFKLGAISDGFSQNFEEALKTMQGYGLSWVEIRKVFGVYNTEATPAQIRRIRELLDQYRFRVSVIDTALYKCTLPGTKALADEGDGHPYNGQTELFERACDRAHAFNADKIRGFTFWRVAEPAKVAPQISDELAKAAEMAKQAGMRLVIENENSCNAATGRELAEILRATPVSNLGANWDVGNGYWRDEVSYPEGYNALDKKRIWHMHLKGVSCESGFRNCTETLADKGQIDLRGQFRALLRDDYQETMSLECEFEAPGLSHSETTKRSMEGLLRVIAAV